MATVLQAAALLHAPWSDVDYAASTCRGRGDGNIGRFHRPTLLVTAWWTCNGAAARPDSLQWHEWAVLFLPIGLHALQRNDTAHH